MTCACKHPLLPHGSIQATAFRAIGEKGHSVIDWAICSATSIDYPVEIHRRDWLRREDDDDRLLSQRPVDVLGKELIRCRDS